MMRNGTSTSFRVLKQIEAGVQHVGYAEAGKSDAPAVIECAAQDWGQVLSFGGQNWLLLNSGRSRLVE
jgi:hypothetical protein